MMRVLCVALLLLCQSVFASDQVVNLFIWSNYLPDSVIHAFEQQTGIRVNISEYDSNEDMYAKLKADPHSGYDVIVPSSYYVERMRKEGMLSTLNHSQIPNGSYMNPALLNKDFDPGNHYSYPYLWGTTGIVVDRRYWDPKTITQWRDLWQKRFDNQLLLYDDPREVFAMGMIVLQHSINEGNPAIVTQAYQKLRSLMPNVRLFSMDAARSAFADDDVSIGMAESGDVFLARYDNPYLVYIYPTDGFAIWEDCLSVPKYAPHYNNAMAFINFIMRPDMSLAIAEAEGYSSPNVKTRQMLPATLRNDPLMYPDSETLKRGQMEGDIKSLPLYMKYWELLKLS